MSAAAFDFAAASIEPVSSPRRGHSSQASTSSISSTSSTSSTNQPSSPSLSTSGSDLSYASDTGEFLPLHSINSPSTPKFGDCLPNSAFRSKRAAHDQDIPNDSMHQYNDKCNLSGPNSADALVFLSPKTLGIHPRRNRRQCNGLYHYTAYFTSASAADLPADDELACLFSYPAVFIGGFIGIEDFACGAGLLARFSQACLRVEPIFYAYHVNHPHGPR